MLFVNKLMKLENDYMCNTRLITWVKNVYSLCVNSTLTMHSIYVQTIPSVQPAIFAHFVQDRPQQSSTYKTPHLSLIKSLFYTLSTIPTITKTKE